MSRLYFKLGEAGQQGGRYAPGNGDEDGIDYVQVVHLLAEHTTASPRELSSSDMGHHTKNSIPPSE
ncbi:uncharacterized protein LACBIDRAFT_298361 [Laccaria bicolor S238N-H82]|uniref:Predicted protein n=1 Tax=Laccaria bicolor (strain S238N-H82 / ATCC MYA-4686) TaxID=486041 RepID=B0E3C7_LACBS|nr:uncharacterized protein LACBIDRAFT_298361 [Laccaria bicolor S238N-H82]EDQ98650.1 predicted protein [Laccaria bicolor S238N-H82]|eukprot:XP_001890697.1 predicted protein [Laccaria bicolor S238N-H82]